MSAPTGSSNCSVRQLTKCGKELLECIVVAKCSAVMLTNVAAAFEVNLRDLRIVRTFQICVDMYQEKSDQIFRCTLCNKPFDNASTLKRHGYYCRSRKGSKSARSRSCLPCVKAKTRCDNRQPQCSRCSSRGLNCQYRGKHPKASNSNLHRADITSIEGRGQVLGHVAARRNQQTSGEGIHDTAFTISELQVGEIGTEQLDWNMLDASSAGFLDSLLDEDCVAPDLSAMDYYAHDLTFSEEFARAQFAFSELAIPPSPTQNLRSLVQRSRNKPGAQGVTNLMLSILRSYPRMMLQHGTNPPFIHPALITVEDVSNSMESIHNCMNLMQMISNDRPGSRKLFWKNVQMECERLRAEYKSLDQWQLLGAMQALLIYILMRVDEGETDHNNHDFLLLATVTATARQFISTTSMATSINVIINDKDLETRWKDWILEESLRRLCVVYQVINMLVYFEPAAMCELPTELLLAPLPASKLLWEANDALVWQAESQKGQEHLTSFGLTTKGNLVKLNENQSWCHHSLLTKTTSLQPENWEAWCSGMDGFGGLIMLTASLVS